MSDRLCTLISLDLEAPDPKDPDLDRPQENSLDDRH